MLKTKKEVIPEMLPPEYELHVTLNPVKVELVKLTQLETILCKVFYPRQPSLID